MMYGVGVPVLMPIGCLSFYVAYWMDKYLFIRYYRTPPRYNHEICVRASKLLMWGLALHCAFSIIILSNGEMFYSKNMKTHATVSEYMHDQKRTSFYDRVTQSHLFIITAAFMVLSLWLVLSTMFDLTCGLLTRFGVGAVQIC